MYSIYVTGVKNKLKFLQSFRELYGTSAKELSNIIKNLPHQLMPLYHPSWEFNCCEDIPEHFFCEEEKEEVIKILKNAATLAVDYIETNYDVQRKAQDEAKSWYNTLTDKEKLHVKTLIENSGAYA